MAKPNKSSQIVIGRNYPDPYAPQQMSEGDVFCAIAIFFAYGNTIKKGGERSWKGRKELIYPTHESYNYRTDLGWFQ